MVRGCQEGCSLARYLAVTQRKLYAHELLSIGLLSHLVSEHPYDSLAFAISQTYNDTRTELIKSRYINPVDVSLLHELIEDMDVSDPVLPGVPQGEWDVFTHPVWQQASLVPEQTLTDLEQFNDGKQAAEPELSELLPVIEQCFSNVTNASVQDTVKKLQSLNNPWSRYVLDKMQRLDKDVLEVGAVYH